MTQQSWTQRIVERADSGCARSVTVCQTLASSAFKVRVQCCPCLARPKNKADECVRSYRASRGERLSVPAVESISTCQAAHRVGPPYMYIPDTPVTAAPRAALYGPCGCFVAFIRHSFKFVTECPPTDGLCMGRFWLNFLTSGKFTRWSSEKQFGSVLH